MCHSFSHDKDDPDPQRARSDDLHRTLKVIDASAEVAVLLNVGPGAEAIRHRIARPGETLYAPHLFEIEVLHALRCPCLLGTVSPERVRLALSRLRDSQLVRYPHTPLIERIWELKDNLTAYDAAYVALAEALDAPLVTLPTSAPGSRSTGRRLGPRRGPQSELCSRPSPPATATRGLRSTPLYEPGSRPPRRRL